MNATFQILHFYNRKKYAHFTNAYNAMIFRTIHTARFFATQNCFTKKS